MRAKRAVTVTREMLTRTVVLNTAFLHRISPAEVITSAIAVWLGDTKTSPSPALTDELRRRPRVLSELLSSRQQCQVPAATKPRPKPTVKRQKPLKQGVLFTPAAEAPPAAMPAPGPKPAETPPKPPRPRDLLFDAIASVCKLDPSLRSNGSMIAATKKQLVEADPPYTPDEVYEFGRRYVELCSWARDGSRVPTAGEVAKYVSLVRQQKGGVPEPPPKRLFAHDRTKNERTARRRLEELWESGAEERETFPDDYPQGERWWT